MKAVAQWDTRGYTDEVPVISQRQLRNESAAVMDAVERGESFVVTRNGVPVAELLPARRPQVRLSARDLVAKHSTLSRVDLAAMRAEADSWIDGDLDLEPSDRPATPTP